MRLTAFLHIVFFSLVAFSQNATQKKILANKFRPLPETYLFDPKAMQTIGAGQTSLNPYKLHLSNLILSLEVAFPGQTYGFLGRDMDMVADAVDAYYLKKGQPGRVTRIKFSTPSTQGATAESVVGLLQNNGLDTDKKNKSPKGLVMIDYTSFAVHGRTGGASQSRQIFAHVIAGLQKEGMTPEQVVSRFNVMTIDTSPSVQKAIDPLTSSARDIAQLKKSIAGAIAKKQFPSFIFKADVGANSMAYGSEWHGRYGKIKKDTQGKWNTTPDQFLNESQKLHVLAKIIDVVGFASSPSFIKETDAKLAKRGIVIHPAHGKKAAPLKLAEPEVKLSADEKFIAEVKTLRALPVLGSDYEYEKTIIGNEKIRLTENGQKVADILISEEAARSPKYFEVATQVIITLFKENKIGSRDARRLLELTFGQKRMTVDQKIAVSEIIKKHSALDPIFTMFAGGRVREKLSTTDDAALKANYNGLLARTAIKLSCRTVY